MSRLSLTIPAICQQGLYEQFSSKLILNLKNSLNVSSNCAKITQDESSSDPFLEELLQKYTEGESVEIQQYLNEWDKATYISVSQNILDHSSRKEIDELKFLRKAYNFNKKRATRVPRTGYRWDGSAVYRRGNEYLIVRHDQFGVEKIVTYGVNDE